MKLVHRTPSVGTVVKKLIAVNPGLTTLDLAHIVRLSMHTQGKAAGEFALAEGIDEAHALKLARKTLDPKWNSEKR